MSKKDEREIKDLVKKEQHKIADGLRKNNSNMFKTATAAADV